MNAAMKMMIIIIHHSSSSSNSGGGADNSYYYIVMTMHHCASQGTLVVSRTSDVKQLCDKRGLGTTIQPYLPTLMV